MQRFVQNFRRLVYGGLYTGQIFNQAQKLHSSGDLIDFRAVYFFERGLSTVAFLISSFGAE